MQYDSEMETVTITVSSVVGLSSLHMWQTQFGWDGNEQTQSTFFQQMPDVAVTDGRATVGVPVDAIITLSTMTTRTSPGRVHAFKVCVWV